jgi:ubiquinone/menaquinone biosynthesis C-methylase UbiE
LRDRFGMAMMRWRIRVVLPHVRGRLLDIGCGLNFLTGCYDGESVGVDVYEWGGVDLVVRDSADLGFPDKAFDTVTVVAALNHIPNRLDALREAHRVLKDDGRLVITMIGPLAGRIYHALRRPWDADQRERGMKKGEVYGLTSGEVRGLLEQSGFRVVHERRFMLGLNRLTLARKIADEAMVWPVRDS